MDVMKIAEDLKPYGVMSRQDICDAAKTSDDTFRDTQLRNLLEDLMSDGTIVRVGRNRYVKDIYDCRPVYQGMYSDFAKDLLKSMDEAFPLMAYQLWELRWLNEFLNHLVGENILFLDVEKDGCEFVYEELRDKYKCRLLLKPDAEQVYRYAGDGTIVIGRLVSEAPGNESGGGAPLEKIIVDLLSEKVLRSLINISEIPDMIRDMFDKYRVNITGLLRYAGRRNRREEIIDILGDRILSD